MTFYELVAIILAAVAIIIPIAQAVWKKWFITAKLRAIPHRKVGAILPEVI